MRYWCLDGGFLSCVDPRSAAFVGLLQWQEGESGKDDGSNLV